MQCNQCAPSVPRPRHEVVQAGLFNTEGDKSQLSTPNRYGSAIKGDGDKFRNRTLQYEEGLAHPVNNTVAEDPEQDFKLTWRKYNYNTHINATNHIGQADNNVSGLRNKRNKLLPRTCNNDLNTTIHHNFQATSPTQRVQ